MVDSHLGAITGGAPSFPGYQPKGFLGWGAGTECECSSALQDISTCLHWVWNSVCFRSPQDAALIPGEGGQGEEV